MSNLLINVPHQSLKLKIGLVILRIIFYSRKWSRSLIINDYLVRFYSKFKAIWNIF